MRYNTTRNLAVSEVVSTLLVLSIVMGSVSAIMLWGIPYIDSRKMQSQSLSLFSDLEVMDSHISGLIIDGPGSVTYSTVTNANNQGGVNIDSVGTKMVLMYTYDKDFDFNVSGLDDNDGEFNVYMQSSGETITDWYDSDWYYRKKITIQHEYVGANFAYFPVLIDTTVSAAQPNGEDILFTNETGIKLYHEIELYNSSTSHLVAWVNVTNLSSTTNTTLYLYYSNSNCEEQWDLGNNVWDSNYVLVQHLNDANITAPDNFKDSSSFGNNGQLIDIDGDTISTTGIIGKALNFQGDGDYIDLGDSASLEGMNDLTISCWIGPNQDSIVRDETIIAKKDAYELVLDPDEGGDCSGNLWWKIHGEDSTQHCVDTDIPEMYYTYLTIVSNLSADKVYLFKNGEQIDEYIGTAQINSNDNPVGIGRIADFGVSFNGTIDEVRISKVARTKEWIKTTYNATSQPGMFCVYAPYQRYDGVHVIHRVAVYKLNPDAEIEDYTKIETYKSIYKDNWYAQKFKPAFGTLDKVLLYISKTSDLTDNLTVSLFDDSYSKIRSVNVYSENVTPYMSWITCDFSNVIVNTDKDYYIVLNTTGEEQSLARCYKWYIDSPSEYDTGSAWESDDGVNWDEIFEGDSDFRLRTYYTENAPPLAPEIDSNIINFHNSYSPLTGITINIPVTSNVSDTTTDKREYRVFWGDGSDTGWSGLLNYGSEFPANHTYSKPGTYQIIFQSKDEHGLENEQDNTSWIFRVWNYGVTYPQDILEIDNDPEINKNTILTNIKLNGTCMINLYNYNDFYSSIPFGRIWIFDIGSLTYSASYASGSQEVIFENGATLYSTPYGESINNPPSFKINDESIALRVTQIRSGDVTDGGGEGTYQFKLKLINSLNRERPTLYGPNVSRLKLQIYGEKSDIWSTYFIRNFGFKQGDYNTLFYNENEKILLLDNSLVEVNLERIK